jgi:hypothetical protein
MRFPKISKRSGRNSPGVRRAPADWSIPGREHNRHTVSSQANYDETPRIASEFTSRLGAGSPLDADNRAFFERRFGHDFGKVRIHHGPEAERLAGSVQARAFTFGRNIVFGPRAYAPSTATGRQLLAHELTHVVQQSRTPVSDSLIQRQPAPAPQSFAQQLAGLQLTAAEKAALAQMVAKGGVPSYPNEATLAGDINFDKRILGEYFFCAAMQRMPVSPWDSYCNFSGALWGTPLFEAYVAQVIVPEYANRPAAADEMKSLISTCDGGLDIWAKAVNANGGKEPAIETGNTYFVEMRAGTITIRDNLDRCRSTQALIMALSFMSRARDLDQLTQEALAGDVSREDLFMRREQIMSLCIADALTAFSKCQGLWKCDASMISFFPAAKVMDLFFRGRIGELFEPDEEKQLGEWWDEKYKKAYEQKHPDKTTQP